MELRGDTPIILKIKSIYPSLKPSQKVVADYILNNLEIFVYSNLASAAKNAGVSETTFVRFAKVLGYSGYRDLHIAIAAAITIDEEDADGIKDLGVDENTEFTEIPNRVIGNSICALMNLKQTLELQAYIKAVEALESARCICVFGSGGSAFTGMEMTDKFLKLGKFIMSSGDPHIQIGYAVSLCKDDVVVGISHSGRTKQTIEALRLAKKQGATVICITNFENSVVARLADIVLLTASHEKTLQSDTMVSRLSQMTIVNMLYLGLLYKNYDKYAPMVEKQNTTIVPMFFK